MRRILLAAALLALLLPASACGGGGGGGSSVPANCGCQSGGGVAVIGSTPGTAMTAQEVALIEDLYAYVNAERQARGLNPLAWHSGAAVVAYDHSIYQDSINTITHDGPGGCTNPPTDCLLQRLNTGGVMGFSAWGENVAAGQLSAQEVMCGQVSWMLSALHCANILSPDFTHVGMGVRLGGGTGPYWTQVFLRIP